MATVSSNKRSTVTGPIRFTPPPGKNPIHDNEAFGDQPGSMDL
jgi:hypothetical protein